MMVTLPFLMKEKEHDYQLERDITVAEVTIRGDLRGDELKKE